MRKEYAETLEVRDLICGACGVELDLMDPWWRWGPTILHPGCFWLYLCFQGIGTNLAALLDLFRFWTSRRYRRMKRRYARWSRLRSEKMKAKALAREPILSFTPLTDRSFIPYEDLSETSRPRK